MFLAVFAVAMISSSTAETAATSPRWLANEFEDYEAYEVGTPLVYEYDGEWYDGEIVKYFDGVYTISWIEDGELEYFDNINQVDKMVRAAEINANPDLYPVGTPVVDTKQDREGVIVDFVNEEYRVEWSNGAIEAYTPGSDIDAIVSAAGTLEPATDAPTEEETDAPTEEDTDAPTEEDTDAPTEEETDAPADEETDAPTEEDTQVGAFPVGTDVYRFFEGDGAFFGKISWFEDGVYEIHWSDDTYETYDNEQEITKMVRDAHRHNQGDEFEDDPWDNGTAVYIVFPDAPYFGEVIDYKNGMYTIRWSDESVFLYDVDETNSMVQDAYDKVEADRAKEGTKSPNLSSTQAAAKDTPSSKSALLNVFLVVLAMGGLVTAAMVYRRRRTGIEATSSSSSTTTLSTEGNLAPSSYKDEPDPEPVVEPLPDVI